jgi:hypothetical protein
VCIFLYLQSTIDVIDYLIFSISATRKGLDQSASRATRHAGFGLRVRHVPLPLRHCETVSRPEHDLIIPKEHNVVNLSAMIMIMSESLYPPSAIRHISRIIIARICTTHDQPQPPAAAPPAVSRPSPAELAIYIYSCGLWLLATCTHGLFLFVHVHTPFALSSIIAIR